MPTLRATYQPLPALGGSIVRVLSLSLSLDLSVSGYADSPPLLGLLSIGFLMLQQVMSCLDKDGVGRDVVVRCVDNFMVGVWDYARGELKVKPCCV